MASTAVNPSDQRRALWLSTVAFTVCFAVWTIFAIIGIQIKQDLGLTETQFGLLVGTPILTGSLIRLILGIWTDQYGGRLVFTSMMLSAAVVTFLLTFAYDYPQFLIAALGVGIAGGSFAVGVAYVSRWYPEGEAGHRARHFRRRQCRRGASPSSAAPFVMVAYGWQTVAMVWAAALALMAVVFWFMTKDDPDLARRRATGEKPEPLARAGAAEEHPGLAFRALLFLRLRRLRRAGAVAAALSDRRLRARHHDGRHDRRRLFGPGLAVPRLWRPSRPTVTARAASCIGPSWCRSVCTFILSYPPTEYVVEGIRGPVDLLDPHGARRLHRRRCSCSASS